MDLFIETDLSNQRIELPMDILVDEKTSLCEYSMSAPSFNSEKDQRHVLEQEQQSVKAI